MQISLIGDESVSENRAADRVLLTAVADGAAGSVTYSLSGVDSSDLSIDSSSGEIRFLAPADFESKNRYLFSVVATDENGSVSRAVELQVTDLVDTHEGEPITAQNLADIPTYESADVDGTPSDGSAPLIDALVTGGQWKSDAYGSTEIFYSFGGAGQEPFEVLTATFDWTDAEKDNFRAALATYEAVTNVEFVEIDPALFTWDADNESWPNFVVWKSGDADLGDETSGAAEVPGYSYGEPLYLILNAEDDNWDLFGTGAGTPMFHTMVHEVGHILGLAHPWEGGDADDATSFQDAFSNGFKYDKTLFTVMSYDSYTWYNDYTDEVINVGPAMLDITALHYLYGAVENNPGDTVYELGGVRGSGTLPTVTTIYDTGGVDTLDFSGLDPGDYLVVNLGFNESEGGASTAFGSSIWPSYVSSGPDATDRSFVAAATGVYLEHVTGHDGDGLFRTNALDNIVTGGAGDDTFYASLGDDLFDGGDGSDLLLLWWPNSMPVTHPSGASPGNEISLTFDGGDDDDEVWIGSLNFVSDLTVGSIILDGGEGFDQIDADELGYLGGLSVDVETGLGGLRHRPVNGTPYDSSTNAYSFQMSGFESFDGTDGDDLLYGSVADEEFDGNDGDDVIDGRGGDDYIDGDVGSDILTGGAGNDEIDTGYDTDPDQVDAGPGDDIVWVSREDTFVGGDGVDTLRFYDSVWIRAGEQSISWDVSYDQDGWAAPFEGEEIVTDFEVFDQASGVITVYDGTDAAESFGVWSEYAYIDTYGGNDLIEASVDWTTVVNIYAGGSGNDTYLITGSAAADSVFVYEDPGQGYDVVRTESPLGDLLGQELEEIWFSRDLSYRVAMSGTVLRTSDVSSIIAAPYQGTTFGYGGDDTIYAWGDGSLVDAGPGDDYIIWALGGGDTGAVIGGDGSDRIIVESGYPDDAVILGGAGDDLLMTGGREVRSSFSGSIQGYQFTELTVARTLSPGSSSSEYLGWLVDGPDGTDLLVGDFELVFDDATVSTFNLRTGSYESLQADSLRAAENPWDGVPIIGVFSGYDTELHDVRGDPREYLYQNRDWVSESVFLIRDDLTVQTDGFRFTAEGLPAGMSIDPDTGRLLGYYEALSYDALDVFTPTISVTDIATGETGSASLYWALKAGNDRPKIDPLNIVLPTGQAVADFKVFDLSDDSQLEGSPAGSFVDVSVVGLPAGLRFDPETLSVSGQLLAGQEGIYTVEVSAEDQAGSTRTRSLYLPVVDLTTWVDRAASVEFAVNTFGGATESLALEDDVLQAGFGQIEASLLIDHSSNLEVDLSQAATWGDQYVGFSPVGDAIVDGDFARFLAVARDGDLIDLTVIFDRGYRLGTPGQDTLYADGAVAEYFKAGTGDDGLYAWSTELWPGGYYAQHVSQGAGLIGTGRMLPLQGLRRLSDVFDGGDGSDTLYLDDWGSAFFLDDLYSGFHERVAANNGNAPRLIKLESIVGGSGDDLIDLTSVSLDLNGTDMRIDGDDGDDILWAGPGDDTLVGGPGDDVLNGGPGADILTGGGGADVFEFTATSGTDTITDFDPLSDEIHFFAREQFPEQLAAATLTAGVLGWSGVTVDLGDPGLVMDDLQDSVVYHII